MNRLMHLQVALILASTTTAGAAATAPMFQGLGMLGSSQSASEAYGISADGRLVVGRTRVTRPRSLTHEEAFIWTAETGMVSISSATGTGQGLCARAVSADGTVVVGTDSSGSKPKAFRWTQAEGMTFLDTPPTKESFAYGVSADGSVIVGQVGVQHLTFIHDPDLEPKAVCWDSTGMTTLGNGRASGVSADGSVIAGNGFRWENGVVTPVGPESLVQGMSADGSTIFGVHRDGPFRWTAATGMVDLGRIPGSTPSAAPYYDSIPYASSLDGAIIVGGGRGWYPNVDRTPASNVGGPAYIWDAVHGMRDLRELLVSEFGFDLTGWTLEAATGISADGLTLTGFGINPQGCPEAWIAHLPEPSALLFLALGGVMAASRRT